MTPTPQAIANPYVGPRTFTREQRHLYFGREREAQDLLARVLSERLVLFYAQSGAGKSSLINTRLIPDLWEAGYAALPVARVGGEVPAGVAEVDNIFLFNLMLSLDQSGDNAQRLAGLSLSQFLAGLSSEDGEQWAYIPPSAVSGGQSSRLPALRADRRPVRGDHHRASRPLGGADRVLPPAQPGHVGRPRPVGGVDLARGLHRAD